MIYPFIASAILWHVADSVTHRFVAVVQPYWLVFHLDLPLSIRVMPNRLRYSSVISSLSAAKTGVVDNMHAETTHAFNDQHCGVN